MGAPEAARRATGFAPRRRARGLPTIAGMSPSQVIVLATPVFLLLIAAEWAWGRARRRDTYRLADAVSSIGLGMLSQISAVFTRLLRVGIYTAVSGWVALWHDDAF